MSGLTRMKWIQLPDVRASAPSWSIKREGQHLRATKDEGHPSESEQIGSLGKGVLKRSIRGFLAESRGAETGWLAGVSKPRAGEG